MRSKQVTVLFSVVFVIGCFLESVEGISYTWTGKCELWTPNSLSTSGCWVPQGVPTQYDEIYVPNSTNLTLYCSSKFSGAANSFYTANYAYGPTCVYQIGSIVVQEGGVLQVSTYLAFTISLPSYIENGGSMVLWGSLAAIDGSGDIIVAGNLSVYGGNIQGNGSIMIEKSGLVEFNAGPSEPLDCYLLRSNVTIAGIMTINNPTMFGFWWEPNVKTIDVTVSGYLHFVTYLVFPMEIEVNFNIVDGGIFVGAYDYNEWDLLYTSLLNTGNFTGYLHFEEVENYNYVQTVSCNTLLNYGSMGTVYYPQHSVNFGNITTMEEGFTITNYGNIENSNSMSQIYNYHFISYVSYASNLYNYGNCSIYNTNYVMNEGIVTDITYVTTFENYGLMHIPSKATYYANIDYLNNYNILYCQQDTYIYQINDTNGIIYSDMASFELQPLYWFWVKDYPQSLYPSVEAYGPEENRPQLLDGVKYTLPLNLNQTSLVGPGSFVFNAPGNIIDNLFIDTSVLIEIWAVNFTNPNRDQYSYHLDANITVSQNGYLSGVMNLFSLPTGATPFLHVFGIVEFELTFSDISIVVHPDGLVQTKFLAIRSVYFTASIQVFGTFVVEKSLTCGSALDVYVYPGGKFIINDNAIVHLEEYANIYNCGGTIEINGEIDGGTVQPCPPYSYYESGRRDHYYAPYEDAVTFVRNKKKDISERLKVYDLQYHYADSDL